MSGEEIEQLLELRGKELMVTIQEASSRPKSDALRVIVEASVRACRLRASTLSIRLKQRSGHV